MTRPIRALTILAALFLAAIPAAAEAAQPAATAAPAAHVRPQCVPDPNSGNCTTTLTGTSKGSPLNIREGSGTGFPSTGSMPYDSTGTVFCYLLGSDVSGDAYWDYVDYGGTWGFVSDYWLYTAGDITSQVPGCDTVKGQARDSNGLAIYQQAEAGSIVGSMPYGSITDVSCFTIQTFSDGTQAYWDYVDYNGVTGFVDDRLLYTGRNIDSQIGEC